MHAHPPYNERDEAAFDADHYAEYAEEYDPDYRTDAALHRRPPKPHFVPKAPKEKLHWHRIEAEKRRSIAGDFDTTYRPGHIERRWLMGTLRPFFEAEHIDDVLSKVKSGKEADVYRCSLTEGGRRRIFAAKLYRPRSHRTMRNDQIYREGRRVLGPQDQTGRARDQRQLRAMLRRTDYGKQAEQTSWLMHEYEALAALHAAGADVPEPIEAAPSAILMEFIGDARQAAPTLHDMRLEASAGRVVFDQIADNMGKMLAAGFIHGDLSAHNILFWDGKAVLIDFPQVVPVARNKQAYRLLARDAERLCQYFAKCGVQRDPEALAQALWGSYATIRQEDILADLSSALAAEEAYAAETEAWE